MHLCTKIVRRSQILVSTECAKKRESHFDMTILLDSQSPNQNFKALLSLFVYDFGFRQKAPCSVFIPAPHQRSSIPTDRQANRAGGEKECYKFLLPKIFATLHFRALWEFFAFLYYFFLGNVSVYVEPAWTLSESGLVQSRWIHIHRLWSCHISSGAIAMLAISTIIH